jgi:hypothetical protein
MWTRTHSTTVKGLDIDKLWTVWSDVDRWHEWQPDLEFAKLNGPFATGSTFTLRPKGGPTVQIELLAVDPGRRFTDLTRFPLGRMYGDHVFVVRGDEIEIQTTVRVEGPLRVLWVKLVADGVARKLAAQTEELISRARAA